MRYLAVFGLAVLIASTAVAQNDVVSFPVTELSGETIEVSAALVRPDGDGPFPAVVLVSGCSGTHPTLSWTEEHLVSLGYVALLVDSFGPRGIPGVCDDRYRYVASHAVRARDAHAGKSFLAGLSYIDDDAIALVGWSHGGTVVLASIETMATTQADRQRPFKAAIAFYPGCATSLVQLDTPLLVMIGDADDWTPAERCEAMVLEHETANDYELVIYPGATHAFDIEGLSTVVAGHKLEFDPEATADAYRRMTAFLAEHLQ